MDTLTSNAKSYTHAQSRKIMVMATKIGASLSIILIKFGFDRSLFYRILAGDGPSRPHRTTLRKLQEISNYLEYIDDYTKRESVPLEFNTLSIDSAKS